MDRRALLWRLGVLGTAAVAGCTGDATPGDTPTETPTDTPSPTPEVPDVEGTSLTVSEITSGQQTDTATVSFDPGSKTVVVEGVIWGSDGCKTAELGTVEYDAGMDTLQVAVVTTDREGTDDQACTQAIVEIDYRARIAFSGGLAGTVAVSHDDRSVARVERDDE